MKQSLSSIRREAFILYAKSHPDVRLEDIALALGYKQTTAIADHFVKTAGLRNPLEVSIVYVPAEKHKKGRIRNRRNPIGH